jgi:hypothetical protein
VRVRVEISFLQHRFDDRLCLYPRSAPMESREIDNRRSTSSGSPPGIVKLARGNLPGTWQLERLKKSHGLKDAQECSK